MGNTYLPDGLERGHFAQRLDRDHALGQRFTSIGNPRQVGFVFALHLLDVLHKKGRVRDMERARLPGSHARSLDARR